MGATSGVFSPVDPCIARSLLLGVESERLNARLDNFQTFAEATHWSGVQYGYSGASLAELKPSAIDIEIGSSPDDWANPDAARVVARALRRTFERANEPVKSLFCVGGVHFEPSFTRAVMEPHGPTPFAVSHVLPNQWLVSEGYDQPERLKDFRACAASIVGGVHAVVFHDKLKAAYKDLARRLADELQVPAFSHKKLKRPETLPI